MTTPTTEELAELAYAIANREILTRKDSEALQRLQDSPEGRDQVLECLKTVQEIRAQLGDSAKGPQGEPSLLDDNTLAEYLDGVLEPAERLEVEAHLIDHPAALNQLIDLSEVLAEVTPSAVVIRYICSVAKKGLQIISHPLEGFEMIQAAPVPVLGGDDSDSIQSWTQNFRDFRVRYSLRQTRDDQVTLSISLVDPEVPPPGSRITIRAKGQTIQSDMLSSSGQVTFRDLPLGAYSLDLLIPTQNTVTMELDLIPE